MQNIKLTIEKLVFNQLKILTLLVFFGVLTGLAPAPFNVWVLAWFSLIPLWLIIIATNLSSLNPHTQLLVTRYSLLVTPSTPLPIWLSALAWGCGYHGLVLFWITGVHPMTWMGVPWLASLSIAIICWLFITFWGALLVVTWSVLVSKINFFIIKQSNLQPNFKIILRVILGITIWCILETLWSHTPLWWSSLAYTQSPSNLVILQLGKISGFNTINTAILGVNLLAAEAIYYWFGKESVIKKILLILASIFLFIAAHGVGYWLYQMPVKPDDRTAIKVGIIQGNIPNEIKLYPAGWRKAIEGYTNGYQRLAKQKIDVVLTPETALPFYWDEIASGSFYRAVIEAKIPAWVGALGREDNSYTNSLFTLTGTGETFSRYDKSILVPLGEYIPFESILGRIIDRLSPLEAHLQAGKSNQIFNTPFGKAIVGICYESAFPQHFRRQTKAEGDFIITASNNAHYSSTMPSQHHAQDVMRAIENDRWAARATNTGYSAIVDPRGKTLWKSQIDRYAIHAETIYCRHTQTLYVRWGDWLTPIWLLLSFIGLSIAGTKD
jgi:apolipoprotein N-acyltransferase